MKPALFLTLLGISVVLCAGASIHRSSKKRKAETANVQQGMATHLKHRNAQEHSRTADDEAHHQRLKPHAAAAVAETAIAKESNQHTREAEGTGDKSFRHTRRAQGTNDKSSRHTRRDQGTKVKSFRRKRRAQSTNDKSFSHTRRDQGTKVNSFRFARREQAADEFSQLMGWAQDMGERLEKLTRRAQGTDKRSFLPRA